MRNYIKLFIFLLIITVTPVFSQTHNAVPLGDPIYGIIETAQMWGLTGILPSARPYSKAQIIKIIDEILHNDIVLKSSFTQQERAILEQHKIRLSPARDGLDYVRGTFSGERMTEKGNYFSYEVGLGLEMIFSGGYYPVAGGYKHSASEPAEYNAFKDASHVTAKDFYFAYDIGPGISFLGDLGRNNSYGLTIIGRVAKNPRVILGRGHNAYYEYDDDKQRQIKIFSEPLAYFPYTYKMRWDGFLFPLDSVSSAGQVAWPYGLSVGYTMIPEFSGAALNGHINYRIARIDREWAGITANSSLILNQMAQPFLAGEIVITPFDWFAISSLTGILEFADGIGAYDKSNSNAFIREASRTFQNAFSIVMLEINIKNYFNIGLGSSAVWPKRFELGYPFPFAENFLYQNNIGDFDNMALFLNLMGQYPRLGKAWFSFYLDEIDISQSGIFSKDRSMYSFQAGLKALIPWLPFGSVTASYTKVEPYNYTHTRVKTPWYGDLEMETNYVNAGRSLGHYIPPNSDEILVRLDTAPFINSSFSFQYQMIRHGADYGNRAVDGSSLYSELVGGQKRSALYKYFLRDGPYQWTHIFKLRGEYSLAQYKWPVKFFMETGVVYSYFTDIYNEDGTEALVNSDPKPFKMVNKPEYPKQLGFICTMGMVIFPKY